MPTTTPVQIKIDMVARIAAQGVRAQLPAGEAAWLASQVHAVLAAACMPLSTGELAHRLAPGCPHAYTALAAHIGDLRRAGHLEGCYTACTRTFGPPHITWHLR